jgi:hypothetical protein
MKRLAIAVACLLASVASASDGWATVAFSNAGTWDIRTSTAERLRVADIEVFRAVVRRTHTVEGQPAANLYTVSLPGAHCAAGAGTLRLDALNGTMVAEERWREGDGRAAAVLAKAVCAAVAGRLR